MAIEIYLISAVLVFVFSGLLAMAGLGAAFLFVPLFYYLGVPLAEATPTALLLNVVSMLFATINYWRGKLINWRVGIPVLITAVVLSPVGARLTASTNKTLLLAMFAAFLIFAGFMMLFYREKVRDQALSRPVAVAAGAGVGSVAGFLGGLLGVGGRQLHPAGAKLAWVGCQDSGWNNRVGGGVLITLRLSGSRNHEQFRSDFRWGDGDHGRVRLDHWVAVDEEKNIQRSVEKDHRRVIVRYRCQDDF